MNVIKSIWETWEQASKLFEKAVENAPTTLDPKEFLEYQIRMSNFVKEAASLSMDLRCRPALPRQPVRHGAGATGASPLSCAARRSARVCVRTKRGG